MSQYFHCVGTPIYSYTCIVFYFKGCKISAENLKELISISYLLRIKYDLIGAISFKCGVATIHIYLLRI
jgi:hypothetical protein